MRKPNKTSFRVMLLTLCFAAAMAAGYSSAIAQCSFIPGSGTRLGCITGGQCLLMTGGSGIFTMVTCSGISGQCGENGGEDCNFFGCAFAGCGSQCG